MPKRKELDTETKAEITAGEKIEYMTMTEGWALVFESLKERILDLQNLNNIDDSSPEHAVNDLRARKLAVDLLWAWVKVDVTGAVEQYRNNLKTLNDPRAQDEGYLDRP